MCQIQIIKRMNGKLTKKDNKEFIKLMSLGSMRNYDAFGMFNHNYLIKAPGDFDYQLINENKIMKNKFIVGHNRLSTTGECLVYPEEAKKEVKAMNLGGMNSWGMNPWCINPLMLLSILWKPSGKEVDLKNYNNHPFKIDDLLLVHNGTLWNYRKLKKEYKIETEIETDSYIILYLISHFLNESKEKKRLDKIVDAIKNTTKKLEGNYSVMLYDKLSRNIIYFRNEFTSFTFYMLGKDLIIGSTNEKSLNYIYEKNKIRKRIPTYAKNIYLITNEVKKIGEFKDV